MKSPHAWGGKDTNIEPTDPQPLFNQTFRYHKNLEIVSDKTEKNG